MRQTSLEEEANVRASMIREYELRRASRPTSAYHQRVKGEGSGVAAGEGGRPRETEAGQHRGRIPHREPQGSPSRGHGSARPVPPRSIPLLAAKSIMTCSQCGYAITYLDATSWDGASFEQGDRLLVLLKYKRINHYTMPPWSTGKEAHRVPDEIMRSVVAELHPNYSVEQVTLPIVRKTLRKLRLRKAYDHAVQIHARLTGVCPPITPDEERMKTMFLQMQPAFQKCAPGNRTSTLSYSYVMYRCFQILGLNHMLPSVVLLREGTSWRRTTPSSS